MEARLHLAFLSCTQRLRRTGVSRLYSSVTVISVGGRVPRVLLGWLGRRLHVVHLSREVIRIGKVECRRVEGDVAPAKACPAVPRRVDPPDEVEMVHILDRAEIRSLGKKKKSWCAHIIETHGGGEPTYPSGRLDRDKAVIRTFLFENHHVWPPAT